MQKAVILAAVLVIGTNAVPTGTREGATCAVICPVVPKGDGIYYEQGLTYVYKYTSDVETTISGSTEEASRLHATAKVLLTSDGACNLQIQLADVTLEDSHPKESSIRTEVDKMAIFKQQLEEKPLTFSYQNGAVEHVCSDPDEPVWVVNFKRAVISMIVSKGADSKSDSFNAEETDISGQCDTSYTVDRGYYGAQVTKVKNLLSCKQRGHLISSLQTTPYRSSSPIQSSPILASTLQCEQEIENQRVVGAVCREQHLFRPFSEGARGAITVTKTEWREQDVVSDGGIQKNIGDDHVKLSPVFDIRDPEYEQVNDIKPLLAVIDQLEEKTDQEVRPEAPRLFAQLVESLRHLDYESIKMANKQLKAPKQRQSFINALSMAGTASSIAMMRDLMLNNDISQAEKDRFMISLAFVHEPSLDMVEVLKQLLKSEDVNKQVFLGVSSLVHEYCKKNPTCIDEEPVKDVVRELEYILPTNCYARSEDEVTKTITALKALGNIGRTVNSREMLIKCITSTENKVEVRLASVNTFKRMPCSIERRETLMNIFSNDRADTEIRIASYLSIMQCPDYYNIEKIGELLGKESVNQVSSFVWTHLSNLKESNDPTKHYVKSLLSNMELKNKFSADIRKFSRYIEKSMYLNSMNTGASVEGAVVFSPESYVPRSAMVNLTLDLFGEAINLFEIGGRAEGMDDLAHDFFGTNRFLPTKALTDFWQYFSSGPDNNDLATNTPKLSTYWKVFGNELGFERYDSLSQFNEELEIRNPLDAIRYLLEEKDLTESANILDSTYIVSTIAGFPFSLRAVGSASVSLKTGGNYNIQSWNKLDINGYLKPSASVEIVGEMGVDAFAARTGLKMASNFHTSTAIDGSLTIDGSSVIVGKINMPKERNEILDVTTRFYSMQQNKMVPLGMNAGDVYQNKICSGTLVDRLLGLKFCTNFQITNPSSSTPSTLLSGPLDAQIYIMKTDSIRAFTFEFSNSMLEDSHKSHLLIDAPGSTVDRRISFDLRHNYESEIRASLHTPIKAFDINGVLQTQGPKKLLKLNVVVDKSDEYAVMTQYLFENGDNGWIVEPSVEVIGSSRELVKIEGSVFADYAERSYGLGVNFVTPYNTPIKVKAGYRTSESDHIFTQSLSCSFFDLDQTSIIRFGDNELQMNTDVDYSMLGSPRQSVIVGVKLSSDTQHESLKTCKLSVNTQFTAMPYLNTELNLVRTKSPTKCHTIATLLHDDRTYMAEAGFERREELIGTKLKLTAKHWGVDVVINGDVDLSKPDVFKFDGTTRLTDSIKAATKLVVHVKNSDLGFHYGVESEVTLPSSSYALQIGARCELNAGHIKFMVAREILGEREEIRLVSLIALEERNTELEITLFVPNVPRVQVFARLINGKHGVYSVGAGVTYGELNYRALLDYTEEERNREHAVNVLMTCPGHDLELSGTAQLQEHEQTFQVNYVYGRKMVATLVTKPFENSLTGDLSLYWDKDVDDSQVLTAAVKANMLAREISASVNYPGQQYELTGKFRNGRFAADLQYGDKRIHTEVSARIRSPTDILLVAALTTPFEGYRKMSLVFSNQPDISDSPQTSKLVNFDLTGQMNEKACRLTGQVISGMSTDKRHSLHTVLDLTSHFQGWERVHFDTTVYAEDGMYSARAAASMNEYSAGIGVLHEFMFDDGSFKLRSELDVKLPIEQLKVAKLSLLCNAESTRVKGEVMASWETDVQEQMSLGLNLTYNPDIQMYYDASLLVRTPFNGHEEYYTRAFVKSDIDDYALLLTLQNSESAKIFHTELNLATDNTEKLQASGEIAIIYYTNVGFNLDSILKEKLVRLNFGGFSDKSNVSLNFYQSSPSMLKKDLKIALSTPYGHYYTYSRSIELTVSPSLYSDQLKITWDDKSIQLDLHGAWKIEMNNGRPQRVEISGRGGLTTPFAGWELSNVTQEVSLEMNDEVKFSGYSTCSVNDKMIELIQNGQIKDVYNWNSNGTIKSNTDLFTNTEYSLRLGVQSFSNGEFHATLKRGEKRGEIFYGHQISDAVTGFKVLISGNASCTDRGLVSFDVDALFEDDDDLIISANAKCPRGMHSINLKTDSVEGTTTSDMTIESPLFEKISLKEILNMDESIIYSLVVSHGSNVYSVDASLDGDLGTKAEIVLNLKSPRFVFGEINFSTIYTITSEIAAKSQINVNDWISTLDVKFAPTEGDINVTTPVPYMREMRASMRLKDESLKMVLLHEQRQMVLTVMRTDLEDYDGVHLHLATPFRGFEILSLTALKHVNQHDYNLDYSRGRFEIFSLAASAIDEKYVLAADISNELIGQAKIEFLMDLAKYKFGINVQSNGEGAKLDANVNLSEDFASFYATYNNDLLRGPKKILFETKCRAMDYKKQVLIKFVQDMDSYDLALEHKSDASNNENVFSGQISKNDQIIKVLTGIALTESLGKFDITLRTPFENYRILQLESEGKWATNRYSAKLRWNINELSKSFLASFDRSQDYFKIMVDTPCDYLKKLKLEYKLYEYNDKTSMTITFSRNSEYIRLSSEHKIDLLNPHLNIKLDTPYDGLKSFIVKAEYDLNHDDKLAFVEVTENNNEYLIRLNSQLTFQNSFNKLSMKTPFPGLESFEFIAMHDASSDEKLFEMSYELNGQKVIFASRGSYGDEGGYVDVITPFSGYERIGMSGKYVKKRGKREVNYEANVDGKTQRFYIFYERKGLDSIVFRAGTPIEEIKTLEVKLESEKVPNGRIIHIKTERNGKKSNAEVKLIGSESSMELDINVHTYIAGWEDTKLNGMVNYGGMKKSFSLSSTQSGKTMEISGELESSIPSGKGKLNVKSPISGLDDVKVEFNYNLENEKAVNVDVTRNGETKTFSGSLKHDANSFDVNIKTPIEGFEALHAQGSRTNTDGKVDAELLLERNDRKIKLNYEYFMTDKSGKAKITSETPYAFMKTAKFEASYDFKVKSRSFMVHIERNSRVWHMKTDRSWENGKDIISASLTSPVEAIKKVELKSDADFSDMTKFKYESMYKRNDKKYSLEVKGGIHEAGKKVNIEFEFEFPSEEELEASISYDITQPKKTVKARASAFNRYADLQAEVSGKEGNIKLETTNKHLPGATITYKVNAFAHYLRDISADITMADGHKSTLVYKADYTKPEEGAGSIDVQCPTYGKHHLTWQYSSKNFDYSANVKYDSTPLKIDISGTMTGERFVMRKIMLKSSIKSKAYTSIRSATINYNLKKGVQLSADIDSNGSKIKGDLDMEVKGGKAIINLSYDGIMIKALKINGEMTVPRTLEGQKDFKFTMNRLGRKTTLSGNVKFGTTLRSGSLKFTLKTPLTIIQTLTMESNWNFIKPNTVLTIDCRCNTKHFVLNLSGTRSPGKSDISLQLNMPHEETFHGKTLNQIALKASYDFTKDMDVKLHIETPIEMKLELNYQKSETSGKLSAVYKVKDSPEDFIPWVDERNLELMIERQSAPTSLNYHIVLKTNYERFEMIESKINFDFKEKKFDLDYKRGDTTVKLKGKMEGGSNAGGIDFSGTTSIKGFEDMSLKANYERSGKMLSGNVDYKRGEKYLKFEGSGSMDLKGKLDSFDSLKVTSDMNIDTNILKAAKLSMNLEAEGVTKPGKKLNINFSGNYNGQVVSLKHTYMMKSDLREEHTEIITPFRPPFRKIIVDSKLQLPEQMASYSLQYGQNKIMVDVSWSTGKMNRYGFEVRAKTPFNEFRSFDLDMKAIAEKDQSITIQGHYRRQDVAIHVTGTAKPYQLALKFDTPMGKYKFDGEIVLSREEKMYSVKAVVTMDSGASIGGEISVKAKSKNDMQLTIDIQTPLERWRRLNADFAFSNTDKMHLLRVAVETPGMKRVEIAFELTNEGTDDKTDMKVSVTSNYLGSELKLIFTILREISHTLLSVEIRSPLGMIPSMKLTGRI